MRLQNLATLARISSTVAAAERIGKALATEADAMLTGCLTASFSLAEFKVTEDAGSFSPAQFLPFF